MDVSTLNGRWAIFDLDDTLGGVEIDGRVGFNNEAYVDVLRKFAAYTSPLLHERPEVIREKQHEIDCDLCAEYGFSDPTRFAKSLVLTFEAFNGSVIPTSIANYLFDLGMSVFDYPYRALPGAQLVLDRARNLGFRIAIATKGSDLEQREKLEQAGIEADVVYVLGRKNDEEWHAVFTQLGIFPGNASEHWAIGNSIKSDVNPPLRAGLNAIHIDVPSGWGFENAEYETPKPDAQLIIVRSIDSCANFFKESIVNVRN